MRSNRSLLSVLAVTAFLFVGSALALGADEEHMFRVGKKGAITFQTEMKIGALTLAPGNYEFQHRVMDSEHVVRFKRAAGKDWRTGVWIGPRQVVAEVQCSLEPLNTKATRTAVYSIDDGGLQRITRVEVRGEDAVHWFSKP